MRENVLAFRFLVENENINYPPLMPESVNEESLLCYAVCETTAQGLNMTGMKLLRKYNYHFGLSDAAATLTLGQVHLKTGMSEETSHGCHYHIKFKDCAKTVLYSTIKI